MFANCVTGVINLLRAIVPSAGRQRSGFMISNVRMLMRKPPLFKRRLTISERSTPKNCLPSRISSWVRASYGQGYGQRRWRWRQWSWYRSWRRGGAKGADVSHDRNTDRNVDHSADRNVDRHVEEVKPKLAKAVRGKDIFVPFEGKEVILDELNKMHRALLPLMGAAHPMVTNLQKAIDAARGKRNDLTEPSVLVRNLGKAVRKKKTPLTRTPGRWQSSAPGKRNWTDRSTTLGPACRVIQNRLNLLRSSSTLQKRQQGRSALPLVVTSKTLTSPSASSPSKTDYVRFILACMLKTKRWGSQASVSESPMSISLGKTTCRSSTTSGNMLQLREGQRYNHIHGKV